MSSSSLCGSVWVQTWDHYETHRRRTNCVMPWTSSCVATRRQTPGCSARLPGGDATHDSDIDLMVDLLPGGGNELLRVAGIAEELSQLLGTRVDVVATSLLRSEVSASTMADAVAV